jgi:phosphate transport system protein
MENQTFIDDTFGNQHGRSLLALLLGDGNPQAKEKPPTAMALTQQRSEPCRPQAVMTDTTHDALKSHLLLMASNAEECVKIAIQSLMDREESLAKMQKDQDDVIDQLEMKVDELALSMLGEATKPEDLRFITMAMRISNELERVGDEATTISRRSLELMKHEPLRLDMPIESMAQMVTDMLKEALDTFVYRKPDLAREIVLRDKQVDQLNKAIQAQMTETMLKHPDHIVRSLHLMTIAKSMERIGDHASNIAEQVVFLCEAEDIRHQ